ncbi:hypothetical protein C8R44DRAFT_882521 [Mycena epipterygia]|nr:hypothetical protein C8R44DRAFT_882521 [Mycena epipterygia]
MRAHYSVAIASISAESARLRSAMVRPALVAVRAFFSLPLLRPAVCPPIPCHPLSRPHHIPPPRRCSNARARAAYTDTPTRCVSAAQTTPYIPRSVQAVMARTGCNGAGTESARPPSHSQSRSAHRLFGDVSPLGWLRVRGGGGFCARRRRTQAADMRESVIRIAVAVDPLPAPTHYSIE